MGETPLVPSGIPGVPWGTSLASIDMRRLTTSLVTAGLVLGGCAATDGTDGTDAAPGSASRAEPSASSPDGSSTRPTAGALAGAVAGGLEPVDRLEADPSMDAPGGIDVDSAGRVHVLDAGNDRVVTFGTDGSTSVIGDGQLTTKGFGGLAVGPDDELYVVDGDNSRVAVLTLDGTLLRVIGADGEPGEGGFATAIGIAVAGDEVFVTDDEAPWVQVFGTDGAYRRRFGGPEVLEHATGIAVAADGTVFVADYALRSVTAFTPDGEVDGVWRNPGVAGTFGTPEGLLALDDGTVLVTDYRRGAVSVLPDEPGDEVAWDDLVTADAPAAGRLATPVDLAVTPDGGLVVTDQTLDVVVRYRPVG